MMAEASNNDSKGVIKVTMQNGDKFLYENIEIIEDQYYGVFVQNDEKIKIPLKEEEIKSIQVKSEKASFFSKFLGITAAVGAMVLGVTML